MKNNITSTQSLSFSGARDATPSVSPDLIAMYAKCRKHKPLMLVGSDAACSLDAARTILAFREMENAGLVRMRAEPETENYFDVFGDEMDKKEKKRMEEIIDLLGCWQTVSEFFDGEEWQFADACGMHTGYKNPLDPIENCYVVQEMQAALDALEAHRTGLACEDANAHDAACRDVVTV